MNIVVTVKQVIDPNLPPSYIDLDPSGKRIISPYGVINNSPDAEIFMRADYGVVGDYREVLPAFIERVKQLRS